jgi:hypothetical protein
MTVTDTSRLRILDMQRTAVAERITNGYREGAADLDVFTKAHEAWLHECADIRRAALMVEDGS